MAKFKLLVDTDIIIDYLKGMKPARSIFNSKDIDIYCSILSKKELFSKKGLRNSERKKITKLISGIKVLKIDDSISQKYMLLINKYGERQSLIADYLIAATAWAKTLPLLTRNIKHYKKIEEIKLSPVYEYDGKV